MKTIPEQLRFVVAERPCSPPQASYYVIRDILEEGSLCVCESQSLADRIARALNFRQEGPKDTIDRLTRVSIERAKRWHPRGLESWSLSDWFTALAGELGELGNVIKKMNRSRDYMKGNREPDAMLPRMLEDETADTFLYLLLFARVAGIDLYAATCRKFNETSQRVGFPERL